MTGGIGSLDAVYQTMDGIDDVVAAAELAPAILELLSDLRGPKTIAEACAGSELSDFEVCQLPWAFHTFGWMGPVTESAMPVMEADSIEADEPVEDADAEGLGKVLGHDIGISNKLRDR